MSFLIAAMARAGFRSLEHASWYLSENARVSRAPEALAAASLLARLGLLVHLPPETG
jgi:hypothetical protein